MPPIVKSEIGIIQVVPLFNKSSVCSENSKFSKFRPIPNKIPIARLLKTIALNELFRETSNEFFLLLAISINAMPTK